MWISQELKAKNLMSEYEMKDLDMRKKELELREKEIKLIEKGRGEGPT